jgi:hypothetical protein
MAYTLTQTPAFLQMPVGTDWIFTVDSTNVLGNYKFKYFVDVYISRFGTVYRVRLKFSPNNRGVGIINLSDILEQYVNPTYLGSSLSGNESQFKGSDNLYRLECPIHAIDKLSLNSTVDDNGDTISNNSMKITLGFGQEYSTNPTDAPTEYPFQAIYMQSLTFNGMAYNNEPIRVSNEYGISLQNWNNKRYLLNNPVSRFLTNAPTAYLSNSDGQRVRANDYATLAFLNGAFGEGDSMPATVYIKWYDINGGIITLNGYSIDSSNGGYNATGDFIITDACQSYCFVGVGLGNLKNWGVIPPANAFTYTVQLINNSGQGVNEPYKYTIQNDDCKGYETIRLTWLNKFGAWDYFNFTKKSIKGSDIKRTTFNAVKGNYGGDRFYKDGYNRGVTTLNTNVVSNITINTDWMDTDEEAAWLEELFISPEVYILEGYNAADTSPAEYGKYVTPVNIVNKRYEKITRANDKVAQYEIELEYSINKKVQKP